LIYWGNVNGFAPNGGDIRRASLDGSGQDILITGLNAPTGPALDLAGGKMYWANLNDGEIRRANLDGTGQETLVNGQNTPAHLALDLAGSKMYWPNNFSGRGDIRRANLDGTGQEIVISGLAGPSMVALNVAGGQMYWVDYAGGDIRRANLDGSSQEILVRNLSHPAELVLDLAAEKMYWTNILTNDIRRANLDGSGQETLLGNLAGPVGLAVDFACGKLYWTDNGGDIGRANLDGTGQETLITGLPGPNGIHLDLRTPVLLTGYSADVISDKDPSARFAQPFDAGACAWFEAGALDDNGTQHTDGLPAGLTFVSATGSGATYQIQPANANNVLQLNADQTGTLTLTTPAAYSTLYVIAASGDGTSSSVGSGTINFADGNTQAFSYNAFDWCNGQGGLHPEAVLGGPIGRADIGPDGRAFIYNQDCDFQVYETVISIDPLHAGVAIVSIDFTGAPDAFWSNIFGVSGQ
jgi:hypothetical protein